MRNNGPVAGSQASVEMIRGDVHNPQDVADAIKGSDTVICALGPHTGSSDVFCADATRHIVDGMKQHRSFRLICITGAMVGEYNALSLPMRLIRNNYRRQMPAQAQDRNLQEHIVTQSGLSWVLVKPPRLTNGPQRGKIRIGDSLRVGLFSSISRSDLGWFIMDEIENPKYTGRLITIQY